jgi:hypothetical protein
LSGLAAVLAAVLLMIGDLLSLTTESENMGESATTPTYTFT